MLDLIRKKQKTALLKFVFWAIIAAFVGTIFLVWGKGSDKSNGDRSVAALVNDTKIDLETFRQAYNNMRRSYQAVFKDQFTRELEEKLQLRRRVIDQLINQVLLVQEGERLGVDISKEQLIKSIADIPAFQSEGKFDKDRYLSLLASQGMTPDLFEAMQMEQLKVEETRKRLMAGVEISAAEVEAAFREQHEQIALSFVRLSPALLEGGIKIDENKLNAFFEEKKENYRIPEKAGLDYILFAPATYLAQVTVEGEDLQKYYQRHLERFDIQEKTRLAHIFFRVPADADESSREKTLDKAKEVLSKARNGEDFAALARQFSDDKKSAENGGEIGQFARGSLDPSVEPVAFDLKSGDISNVIQTPGGYSILKALEHTPARIQPLEEVKGQVEKAVREEKALEMAMDKAMDAYNINRKGGSLKAAADANQLKVQQTGLFARGESVPGLGKNSEIAAQAFTLEAGQLARPLLQGKSVILASLRERQESHLPELKEVRPLVEQAYRNNEATALAITLARTIIDEVNGGKSLADVAAAHEAKIQETGFFSRTSKPSIPKLGNMEEWFDKVFELSESQPLLTEPAMAGNDILVVALKEFKKADVSRLDDKERESLRKTLQARKEQDVIAKKLTELKAAAKITYGAVVNDR